MFEWDVMIVGAGPAGSALACRLRPHYRVLLLDRDMTSASPRTQRIGESLPGAARVLLQHIGVFDRFLADEHTERGATISQWDGHEPVWFDHLRDPNGPGWHLDRARFDNSLREAASEAGAELIEGCGRLRVTHYADNWYIHLEEREQTHCAPIVVDASGRSATVSRQIGLARHTEDNLACLYVHLQTALGAEDGCTRLCAEEHGWWYTVRVPSGHRVLAFHLDTDDPKLKTLRKPGPLLARARKQSLIEEALADTVADTSSAVQVRPADSAVLDLDALDNIAPGFFAIGDAVLAFDPLSSQGIFHALASAESAAGAIAAHLADKPNARKPYLSEMKAVHARYREHLEATYASVVNYQHKPFWSRRLVCVGASAAWRGNN